MRNKIFLLLLPFFFFSCKNKKQGKHTGDCMFGIDVSQYQGDIDWNRVASQRKHDIDFVIVRATMGSDREDKTFQKNFYSAKKYFIVGAYHYYDPNENSTLQAENYLRKVKLQPGDFIPILDIERLSSIQSKTKLIEGVKNWMIIVEKEYGVKPILYTSLSFYHDYLEKDLSDYPIWIAAYSLEKRDHATVKAAEIHQFTEDVKIPGITENTVDGNDIRKAVLESLLIK